MNSTNSDPILQGLKRLSASQRPGQSFTISEIAAALKVDRAKIKRLETSAMKHVTELLAKHDAKAFADMSRGCSMVEIIERQSAGENGKGFRTAVKATAAERMRAYRHKIDADPRLRQEALAKQRARVNARRLALRLQAQTHAQAA